jgi:hypothetical protein
VEWQQELHQAILAKILVVLIHSERMFAKDEMVSRQSLLLQAIYENDILNNHMECQWSGVKLPLWLFFV